MTKFEQVGINHLYDCASKVNLNNAFDNSCNCCCNKGMHLECDKCAIAYTHSLLMAIMDDKAKA